MIMIDESDQAPNVKVTNQHGDLIELSYERPTVVYFYPEDGTPGCATEAEQFERERGTYRDAGVDIYGVSRDSVESHREFSEELDLSFDLLADPDGDIGEQFDVPSSQDRYNRTTLVIVNGQVHAIHENVQPDGHAREVLMELLEDDLVSLD